MATLDEIILDAQSGQAISMLGQEFGLSPEQAQAAIDALIPAISIGLKRATATPEGLANLLAVTGHQRDLRAMYDDPSAAFGPEGRRAGDDVLSVIFGSPEISRAVAKQAQLQSGIGSAILRKLLPVLVGMIISGLFGRKATQASPSGSSPTAAPTSSGGGLWDILEQVFRRGVAGQSDPPQTSPQKMPSPAQPAPYPAGGSPGQSGAGEQAAPGNDFLIAILRELEKAIQDGRLKPVIIKAPVPGGQGLPSPSNPPAGGATSPNVSEDPSPKREILPGPKMPTDAQEPGMDVLSKILRDLFGGGALGRAGISSAAFSDRFEPGRHPDPKQMDEIERTFDRYAGLHRG